MSIESLPRAQNATHPIAAIALLLIAAAHVAVTAAPAFHPAKVPSTARCRRFRRRLLSEAERSCSKWTSRSPARCGV